VLTAVTAQNTVGVLGVVGIEPDFVGKQLAAVLDDLQVAAAKTGMLARATVVEAVAEALRAHPVPALVVDPVMVASSGDELLDAAGVAALRARLLPIATLVTPNLREAEALTGRSVASLDEMRNAAVALVDLGARAALVKGGHLRDGERAVDVFYDGERVREYVAPRVSGRATHGTGCTLSAAITAGLAQGRDMGAAIANAKRFVTRALGSAEPIGRGAWPLNHLVTPVGGDDASDL
jgi:hydroxymethylpyrimidine/phosphomethylpyrimidine kinase